MREFRLRRLRRQMRWLPRVFWLRRLGVALVVVGLACGLPVDWLALLRSTEHALLRIGFPGALAGTGLALLVIATIANKALRPNRNPTNSQPEVRPLRWWWVLLVALSITAVSGLVLLKLLDVAAQAPPAEIAKIRIEAVRTTLTLAAGLVGVVALVFTSRRQWLAEHSQRHTESDAAEQRATDLYSAAAAQLDSDKAPVRLAGLYTLERIGQVNKSQRQTVINLLCAYLRVHFTHPNEPNDGALSKPADASAQEPFLIDLAPTLAAAAGLSLDGVERQEGELEVRRAAQNLICSHLRPDFWDKNGRPGGRDFWGDLRIDLSSAVLHDWDASRCSIHGNFSKAQFHGETRFSRAHVSSSNFSGAKFFGEVRFGDRFHKGGQFEGIVSFMRARFYDVASFEGLTIEESANFLEAEFERSVKFDEKLHAKKVDLYGARVRRDPKGKLPEPTWPSGWKLTGPVESPEGKAGRWDEFVPQAFPGPLVWDPLSSDSSGERRE
ncbi:pentapeptide repeat-containing protein [Saccharopolyspora sp. SCSIO 74807]|uniref:pentapeptide repeat-containing protein n=1 Tax=Saccharopolyspora sp. SCSIO 74807 TaxID=3118084 RepID=UPI0030D267A1